MAVATSSDLVMLGSRYENRYETIVHHFDGTTWREVPVPLRWQLDRRRLWDVAVLPDGGYVAVGDGGTVLEFRLDGL